ncbi:choice-of-anchor J domain-containing protein [Paraflavitalea speifideaquila]|uniref:choice-of-anchor J domain-containing protein n=1 Tax=Paraflavitalea speifideaquila TaxID=3076558 RepID=UPI0028F08DE1|nr:choice-of-anchor J domain-containing protein [Paraflavitalea speifideiaquila]
MRKSTLTRIVLSLCVVITGVTACKKDDPATLIPPPLPDQSFVEEFDTVANAWHRGWIPLNNSNPKGSHIWVQASAPMTTESGQPIAMPLFPAYSSKGSHVGYVICDAEVTSGGASVASNWLISPAVWMKNGDKIIFYSRCALYGDPGEALDYGNNLEICINRKNDGTNVGTSLIHAIPISTIPPTGAILNSSIPSIRLFTMLLMIGSIMLPPPMIPLPSIPKPFHSTGPGLR